MNKPKQLFKSVKLTAVAMAATLSVSAAQASINALGLDSSLNLLTFGDFSVPSSDVQGRVAVGGNANISGYSINTAGPGPLYSGVGLTVGGNLTFGSGNIFGTTLVGGNLSVVSGGATFSGNVQVGGSINANGNDLHATSLTYGGMASNLFTYQVSLPTQSAAPVSLGINFSSEKARLTNLTQSFDNLANTGTASLLSSTLTLNAQNANLAVFDISAADVNHSISLDNLGANTTVVINVHGANVTLGGHNYTNFADGRVLFNLLDATQVTLGGSFVGSILAPTANFSGIGGTLRGQVVANSWSGGVQVNDVPFNGTIPAVPEPSEYALMLAGLATIGVYSRRRRQV
jgi:choice-of-anchor A domain-containing protein